MYKHDSKIHNTKSAKVVVPYLLNLVSIKSVIDIGTGTGSWIKVFQEYGIENVLGVDGDYIDDEILEIPKANFLSYDLRKELNLKRKFDLAVSLEVIEHIPKKYEDIFLKSLVNHSDLILFSGAIPEQGGQNHFNEQWQSYWGDKFNKHGYRAYDIFRLEFFNNQNIEWWYRQNIILYSKNEIKGLNESKSVSDLVSKELYSIKNNIIKNQVNQITSLKSKIFQFQHGLNGIREPFFILLKAIWHKISRKK